MLFSYFLLFLLILSLYSIYITNILIAPSITDDSTANKKLNNFLISSVEAAEQFENRIIVTIRNQQSADLTQITEARQEAKKRDPTYAQYRVELR